MAKLDWDGIVDYAEQIVRSYDTGVTLRQLFYRLVSAQILPNTQNAYKGLSRYTARARRERGFPDLIDRNRSIHRYTTFESPEDALDYIREVYRRPRDEGQEWTVYVGVEKSGIVEQLMSWFGQLGIYIVALGGYSSQSYIDEIVRDVEAQERSAVFIYAGDFDPSGEDIQRDFLERTDCWAAQHRIALTPSQITRYNLPPLPGKTTDSRAAAFTARHGQLMQVELDALDPNVLRQLYKDEIDQYFDHDLWSESVTRENRERKTMKHGEIVLTKDHGAAIRDYVTATRDYYEPSDVEEDAVDSVRDQLDQMEVEDDDSSED